MLLLGWYRTMRYAIYVFLGAAMALSPNASVFADSAREQGRQAAQVVLNALTVAHCAVKYETWTESQASKYIENEMSKLSSSQIRAASRVSDNTHRQAVNRALSLHGGCHNYLLDSGNGELLPGRTSPGQYSDQPF